jgi:pimeloyl-ACP methyl ester carboxylesterase
MVAAAPDPLQRRRHLRARAVRRCRGGRNARHPAGARSRSTAHGSNRGLGRYGAWHILRTRLSRTSTSSAREAGALLLLHGLGSRIASLEGTANELARTNEVIVVDLPGHGRSPAPPEAGTFGGVADGVAGFLRAQKLEGIDVAGLSLGGRVALELARRGLVGATVALAPGGFWNAAERRYLKSSLLLGAKLSRWTRRLQPFLTRHRPTRAALLAQLSAKPRQVPPDVALQELRSFSATPAFEALVQDLADGPAQEGTADTPGPVTIVWGRKDRLLVPRQAEQAKAAFPGAQLHWIEDCGHYIPWDAPEETVRLIRAGIGGRESIAPDAASGF